jgi:hypothetical protein
MINICKTCTAAYHITNFTASKTCTAAYHITNFTESKTCKKS